MYLNNWKSSTPWIVSLLFVGYGFMLQDPYFGHLFLLICVYSLLAVSLRFVMLVGEINLAHASFFGIGAYTSAVLTMQANIPFILALLISGLVSVLVSLLFGWIAFRLKGAYFLLLSFAMAEVIRLFFQNSWTDIFGGVNGIAGIPIPMTQYTGFISVMTVLLLFGLYYIEKSDMGKILHAINNSDQLARSIGVNVMKYKIIVLAIASFIAGLCGSMFAHFNLVISPQDFTFHLSIIILSFVIIGGRNYFIGPVIGAIFLTIVSEYVRGFGSYDPLVYGGAILLAMIFLKDGLIGAFLSIWKWLVGRVNKVKYRKEIEM